MLLPPTVVLAAAVLPRFRYLLGLQELDIIQQLEREVKERHAAVAWWAWLLVIELTATSCGDWWNGCWFIVGHYCHYSNTHQQLTPLF